jgi:hypothetical protein
MSIPQQRLCVLRNHHPFIRQQDEGGPGRARYPQHVPGLVSRIGKLEPLDNLRPNADGIFADACISIEPGPGDDN